MKTGVIIGTILLVITCLLAITKADITTKTVAKGEYPASVVFSDFMAMYWGYNATTEILEIAMVGKTDGMLSVCFGITTDGMTGCDFVGGFINSTGGIEVRDGDLFGIGSVPSQDTHTSIVGYNGGEIVTGGVTYTTIKIQRSLLRKHTGKKLKDSVEPHSWCYTPSKTWTAAHTALASARGRFSVNMLAAGKAQLAKDLFPFHYFIMGIMIALVIICGFIVNIARPLKLSIPFQLLLYRPLVYKPLPHWMLYRTPAIILKMTFGELLVLFAYLVHIGMSFLYVILNSFVNTKWSSPGDPISRLLGELGLFHISLVLAASSKNSIFFLIFGIPFERAIKYHAWAGSMMYLCIFLHGFILLIEYSLSASGFLYIIQWQTTTTYWVGAGPIAFVFFTLLVLCSMHVVRRKMWELFRITHFLFYHAGIVFTYLHLKSNFLKYTYMILPGVLYLIDIIIRIANYIVPVKIHEVKVHKKTNVTEVILSRPFILKPKAGQYLFFYCPQVSPLQSHPFSIANDPSQDDNKLRIMAKDIGGYTKKLLKYASIVAEDEAKRSKMFVRLEGPYGSPALPINDYQQVALVAGGIGITPIVSHALEMLALPDTKFTKHINLLWVMRTTDSYEMLADTFERLSNMATDKKRLHITLGFSNATQEEKDSSKVLAFAAKFNTDGVRRVEVGTFNEIEMQEHSIDKEHKPTEEPSPQEVSAQEVSSQEVSSQEVSSQEVDPVKSSAEEQGAETQPEVAAPEQADIQQTEEQHVEPVAESSVEFSENPRNNSSSGEIAPEAVVSSNEFVSVDLIFQRPDLKQYILGTRSFYAKSENCPPLGVMVCGPLPLIKGLNYACASCESVFKKPVHFFQHEFTF